MVFVCLSRSDDRRPRHLTPKNSLNPEAMNGREFIWGVILHTNNLHNSKQGGIYFLSFISPSFSFLHCSTFSTPPFECMRSHSLLWAPMSGLMYRHKGFSHTQNLVPDQTYLRLSLAYTPFISPNAQSLRTELHFQFIRFAAATLLFAFTPSVGFPHFGECGLKNGAR